MNRLIDKKIAILIPCFNEEATIGKVIESFRKVLPRSTIYVYDNNSTDDTYNVAAEYGVVVNKEINQGKGNVIRRMFADIDADIYVMVDGDLTYNSSVVTDMIDKLVDKNLDMVNCARISTESLAYRLGHRFGNRVLTLIVQTIFGKNIQDLLSGYRVFSKRFVKTFPAHSREFEIETELTVHSLEMRLPIAEIRSDYYSRPEGSVSKLSTYRDGIRILYTILKLVFTEKPYIAFTILSLFSLLSGVLLGWFAVIQPWMDTGLVVKIPSAILATGLVISSLLLFVTGVIAQAINIQRKELFRLKYLSFSPVMLHIK